MAKPPHAADVATLDAMVNADHFRVSLFLGPGLGHEVHPLRTLALAREAANLLPIARQSSRQAIVYAVTKDGRSFMIPHNLQPPLSTMGNDMNTTINCATPKAGYVPPAMNGTGSFTSRDFSDRSNCRKAMIRHAQATAHPVDHFTIQGSGKGPFRFVTATSTPAPEAGKGSTSIDLGKADDAIPAFLRLDPAERKAGREESARKAAKVAQEATRKAATSSPAPKAEKKAARAAPPVKGKKRSPKDRAPRHDWAAAEEAARKGKMPTPPDFSANTHRYYRPKLEELVKLAKAGDVKGLKGYPIKPTCTSPRAMDRYRNLAIIALKAKAG